MAEPTKKELLDYAKSEGLGKPIDVMGAFKPFEEEYKAKEKSMTKSGLDQDIEEVLTRTGKILRVIKKHRAT